MGTVKRKADWEHRLVTWMRDNRERRFVRGSWDCCMGGLSAIEAMTDADLSAPFKGYSTREGAVGILRKYGGLRNLSDAVARENGFRHIKKHLVKAGDIVLIPAQEEGYGLGVVELTGHYAISVTMPGGFLKYPVNMVIAAWRIPLEDG